MKKLLLILCLLLITTSGFCALTEGTNCGFVTTAPTANPGGGTILTVDNNALGAKFTSPAGATTITEIGWYCSDISEEANFEVGAYDHDATNNIPINLLAGASQTNAKGTTEGWKVATGLSISITENTVYWLGAQVDNTVTSTFVDVTNNVSYKEDRKSTQTTLPSPWGTSSNTDTKLVAIYAVYTTGGEARKRMFTYE